MSKNKLWRPQVDFFDKINRAPTYSEEHLDGSSTKKERYGPVVVLTTCTYLRRLLRRRPPLRTFTLQWLNLVNLPDINSKIITRRVFDLLDKTIIVSFLL